MINLDNSELNEIRSILEKYDFESTVSQLSSLLTIPVFQGNTLRLEILIHLAISSCVGKIKPSIKELSSLLNEQMKNTQILSLEDNVDDVFITNIETSIGNLLIFEGPGGSNDYNIQTIYDVLDNKRIPEECRNILIPCLALLKLSDIVARSLGLKRWDSTSSYPGAKLTLPTSIKLQNNVKAIHFSYKDLKKMKIDFDLLRPFILSEEKQRNLLNEHLDNSSLERHPVIKTKSGIIITLPHTISLAIIMFILKSIKDVGQMNQFDYALGNHQYRQIQGIALKEIRNNSKFIPIPAFEGELPVLNSELLKYDFDKYIHIVFIKDDMDECENDGLYSYMPFSQEHQINLSNYINTVAEHCKSQNNYTIGFTMLVNGGLGRGIFLDSIQSPENWVVFNISVPDLLMMSKGLDDPLDKFFKCLYQKHQVIKQGVQIQSFSGEYNFYCYWLILKNQIMPRDLETGKHNVFFVDNSYLLPERKRIRRLEDRHLIGDVKSCLRPVIRLSKDPFFKKMKNLPIYFSETHLYQNEKAVAIQTKTGSHWLIIVLGKKNWTYNILISDLLNGLAGLYYNLFNDTNILDHLNVKGATEIRLDFSNVLFDEVLTNIKPKELEAVIDNDLKSRIVKITLPQSFLMHFQGSDYKGEKILFGYILSAFIELQGSKKLKKNHQLKLLSTVLNDPGMKLIHLFISYYPADLLINIAKPPKFIAHEDFIFSKINLSKNCYELTDSKKIKGLNKCNDFLHKVVAKIWIEIKPILKKLDRNALIKSLLDRYESVIHDRNNWNKTSKALISLYGNEKDTYMVAQKRELDRSLISNACRTAIEMCNCESPENEGIKVNSWVLEELLSKIILMIEVGLDSEAIQNNLIEPAIEIHPNGEYSIDRSFYETVIKPFQVDYHQASFETSAKKYDQYYKSNKPSESNRLDNLYASNYISAFEDEYSITPDETMECFGELIDLAVELDTVIVATTINEVIIRTVKNRGLPKGKIMAFFNIFCTVHRPNWDKPPKGFKFNDIAPWRFRRRLSMVSKPLIVNGLEGNDTMIFGVRSFQEGCHYLLEKSEDGILPLKFFKSQKMKSYIGSINNQRGHEFAEYVGNEFEQKEWNVRCEIEMTELGASSKLGDVDVLAWKQNGEVLIVECKRLQFSKTIAEIAGICRRFQGEVKDDLDKHLQRVQFIKSNLNSLTKIIGFTPDIKMVDHKLITNTTVPMTYLKDLPIESSKIGSLSHQNIN